LSQKIVEKPPKNSAGFCGGGHGLSWAVQPRKEEEEEEEVLIRMLLSSLPSLHPLFRFPLFRSILLPLFISFLFPSFSLSIYLSVHPSTPFSPFPSFRTSYLPTSFLFLTTFCIFLSFSIY
jgi:hypothetical protein